MTTTTSTIEFNNRMIAIVGLRTFWPDNGPDQRVRGFDFPLQKR
jgi:hypothetical protein